MNISFVHLNNPKQSSFTRYYTSYMSAISNLANVNKVYSPFLGIVCCDYQHAAFTIEHIIRKISTYLPAYDSYF